MSGQNGDVANPTEVMARGGDTGVGANGDNGGDRSGGMDTARRSGQIVPLRTGAAVAGIVPTTIEEVFRLASAVAKSGMAPRDMASAEKLTVAIMQGLEIGIPPMMAINKIAVVNGRPTLWGDAIPALLWSKGFKLRESFETGPAGRAAVCIVVRPGGEEIERVFSEADAKTAGLWGKQGPWKQYPDRMLQMRARGLAARDGAADVLAGIYIAEEMQDVEPDRGGELLDQAPASTMRKSSSQAKKDGDDVAFNELRGAISGADTLDDLATIESTNAEFMATLPHGWARIVATEMTDKRKELEEAQRVSEVGA